MAEDKKFILDKDTLEAQCGVLNSMIEGDKVAIAENEAIARDPNHIFDKQGEWAAARKEGNIKALNQHEQQLIETKERLRNLSGKSSNE